MRTLSADSEIISLKLNLFNLRVGIKVEAPPPRFMSTDAHF